MKKIIGIFVSVLLIVTTFSAMGMTIENRVYQINDRGSGNGEELDQYQLISDDVRCSFDGPEWYAQSFIPTQSITSKVEIFVEKRNCPNHMYVGIKHDLYGEVIVSTSIHPGLIPATPSWVEFDIPDVYTPLDETCYIVITEEGASPGTSTYQIYGSKTDVYEFGSPFYSHDEAKSWENKQGDLAFKTYVSGMDTPPGSPLIIGPSSGRMGMEILYRFNAVDPEGDDVKYIIDWGDGTTIEMTSFHHSGTDAMIYHEWKWTGTFTINVTAKDRYEAESDWSTFTVSITRDRTNTVFLEFLDLLQRMFPRLYNLLGN
ncbi:MAG: PKD domain-containing protein [Thermoplasmatales archaeon]|nr:PKD domain-containing protein [Thermoplasmatales archaeon]